MRTYSPPKVAYNRKEPIRNQIHIGFSTVLKSTHLFFVFFYVKAQNQAARAKNTTPSRFERISGTRVEFSRILEALSVRQNAGGQSIIFTLPKHTEALAKEAILYGGSLLNGSQALAQGFGSCLCNRPFFIKFAFFTL